MATTFSGYLGFLEKLTGTLKKLTDIAKEKCGAVRRDDLAALDDCMKREQVLSLSLRSMDKQREQMLADLGLKGVPLSGLAERYPAELRMEAKQAAAKLRRQFDLYKSAAQTARNMLEVNLHEIEKYMGADVNSGGIHTNPMADIRA